MKKVNKQCLLDTPRTVTVSEKTWQVIVKKPADLSFEKKISEESVQNKNNKLLHAYVQCVYIVSAKYQIASSKAVVGVDRPIKALSMHILKPYKVLIVKVHTPVTLSKIIFSKSNSFMHMFNVSTLYRQSIKLFHQKLW